MRGGMRGPGGGRRRSLGAGAGSGSATPRRGATVDRASEERAAAVRDAIRQALAVLAPGQRARATHILAAHDIDLDPDHPELDTGSDDD